MQAREKKIVDRPRYWLIGLTKQGVTLILGGNDIENLKDLAQPLRYYSIFRNKPGFWSSTQAEYLVYEHLDPLWKGPVH